MRWSEVIEDPRLQDLPFKIELNRWGNIVMSPASNRHGYIQTALAIALNRARADGITLTGCSIQTDGGVKVADVAWGSDEFFRTHELSTPYPAAPELCVEITSPSNSPEEMAEKTALYLTRDAREVWLCDDQGRIRCFDAGGPLSESHLFPSFPNPIELKLPRR